MRNVSSHDGSAYCKENGLFCRRWNFSTVRPIADAENVLLVYAYPDSLVRLRTIVNRLDLKLTQMDGNFGPAPGIKRVPFVRNSCQPTF